MGFVLVFRVIQAAVTQNKQVQTQIDEMKTSTQLFSTLIRPQVPRTQTSRLLLGNGHDQFSLLQLAESQIEGLKSLQPDPLTSTALKYICIYIYIYIYTYISYTYIYIYI